ncbi:unnamed protein product [Prorocentrum cordatum]|uniref:C2 Aida-type domain-containing protein n=1 Tax=Prorocentrum cordatum TaxID=2364126 RepID=A0ABN9SVM7_9DINO|nr:unnamed protein product [Polarella glacialis]
MAAAAAAPPEKEPLRLAWAAQLRKAQQADSWGQLVEAQEEYQNMAASVASKQCMPSITSKEKDTMQRISLCLSARVHALKTMSENITANEMTLLQPVVDALFTGAEPEQFPIASHKYQSVQPVRPSMDGEIVCGDEAFSDWQQHQDVLKNVHGTVVAIRVDKIGLKDAQEYIDPFMTILVADDKANILDTHDIPVAKGRQPTYCIFEHQIYLNVSFEDMDSRGAALFFEFKHYKPKKKKVSTRCWAFMELAELRPDSEIVLELYQKPTDLKKKKLKLHTEKQLYLHLLATFVRS